MPQTRLFITTVTTGSLWRTIVSNSCRWKPIAPSPVTWTMRRFG